MLRTPLIPMIIVLIVAGAFVLQKKQKGIPKSKSVKSKTLTVPELRSFKPDNEIAGAEYMVKGICTGKRSNGNNYALFLDTHKSDSTAIPLKCLLKTEVIPGFSSLEINTEMVVSGKLFYVEGMAQLKEVTILSQSVIPLEKDREKFY